jgi:hypothetical protein
MSPTFVDLLSGGAPEWTSGYGQLNGTFIRLGGKCPGEAADYRLPRPYLRVKIAAISRMMTTGTIRIFHGLSNRSPIIMP